MAGSRGGRVNCALQKLVCFLGGQNHSAPVGGCGGSCPTTFPSLQIVRGAGPRQLLCDVRSDLRLAFNVENRIIWILPATAPLAFSEVPYPKVEHHEKSILQAAQFLFGWGVPYDKPDIPIMPDSICRRDAKQDGQNSRSRSQRARWAPYSSGESVVLLDLAPVGDWWEDCMPAVNIRDCVRFPLEFIWAYGTCFEVFELAEPVQ